MTQIQLPMGTRPQQNYDCKYYFGIKTKDETDPQTNEPFLYNQNVSFRRY